MNRSSSSHDIEAVNLQLSYRSHHQDFLAISDINLYASSCEIVSIIGPSGCGKTTLLRLLCGIDKPSSGYIHINQDRAMKGIGYVPQDPQLLPWRTMLQNAFIGTEIHETDLSKSSIRRANSLIQKFRLSGFENVYPHQLSGGMAQRVSLIRALQFNPGILFCDEPFSAVDFVSRFDFNNLFRQECDVRKITCILVTHNIEEAIFLSDRIYLMSKSPGRIVKEYCPRGLPDIYDPIKCRMSNEFKLFFNQIWEDLQDVS
jgi:NitT/TauT family transport system ATP-binding protein